MQDWKKDPAGAIRNTLVALVAGKLIGSTKVKTKLAKMLYGMTPQGRAEIEAYMSGRMKPTKITPLVKQVVETAQQTKVAPDWAKTLDKDLK